MADYAKHFEDLKLWKELGKSTGRDGLDAQDVTALQGLVIDVAELVGPVLQKISATFPQYTAHDILHSRNVADRMGRLIPKSTLAQLNGLEITLLLLAALIHDAGMVVSDAEKAETVASKIFKRFREESHADRAQEAEKAREQGEVWRARLIEDALLAEYYRRLHAGRARKFLREHLADRLKTVLPLSHPEAITELGDLCESHSWGVEASHDPAAPEKAVLKLPTESLFDGTPANLQYLACILRLADILDFDRSRTPLTVFQHLTLTEPLSWQEWNKHLQVKGWLVEPDRLRFDIPCSHPAFYVAVQEFLGWIDQELTACRQLIENQPGRLEKRYQLQVPHIVDRSRVRMADSSYVAGAFRFQLEYEEILRLLMDKSLYPDPSLFLRELLQNALDACRRKEAEAKLAGRPFEARIVVRDLSEDPRGRRIEFEDNGVGMSLRIVEQYFLRVGKSYYRSQEFDAERRRLAEAGIELDACSQFGIGILSCFLVCDRFEVLTRVEGGELLHLEVEGPSRYFSIQRLRGELPGKPSHGTRVIVHLRPDTTVDCAQILSSFAVNVDYAIVVESAAGQVRHTIPARLWEREIGEIQCGVDGDRSNTFDRKIIPADAIFCASRIPFEDWEFSSAFRGQAWFWFLKGMDGKPTFTSGYLRCDLGRENSIYLSVTGPANFLAASIFRKIPQKTREELADLFERHLDPDGPLICLKRYSWDGQRASGDVAQQWSKLSLLERHAVIESFRAYRPQQPHWGESVEALRSLAAGDLEWASLGLQFPPSSSFEIFPNPRSVAVQGIHIPVGIVSWYAARATSIPVALRMDCGGVQLDFRGHEAPRLGASRLWLSVDDCRALRLGFYRGLIRHGVDLAAEGRNNRSWFSWLYNLISSVPDDLRSQIYKQEASYLASRGIPKVWTAR
jgi:hypothetical protein